MICNCSVNHFQPNLCICSMNLDAIFGCLEFHKRFRPYDYVPEVVLCKEGVVDGHGALLQGLKLLLETSYFSTPLNKLLVKNQNYISINYITVFKIKLENGLLKFMIFMRGFYRIFNKRRQGQMFCDGPQRLSIRQKSCLH